MTHEKKKLKHNEGWRSGAYYEFQNNWEYPEKVILLEKIEQGTLDNSNSNHKNTEQNKNSHDVDNMNDEYNESDKENRWIRVSKNRK